MADNLYYIDRIKYGKTNNNDNKYLLLDSGALHDDSTHKLIGTTSDFKIDGNLYANNGIFNYIKAVDADITNLSVDDLKAQRATVAIRLDVEGELHTNSWTASNISTIDGAFYITPTVSCDSGTFTYNGTSITVTAASGYSFGIDDLYMGGSTTALTSSWWTQYSYVILTGDVLDSTKDEWKPLGTIRGRISGTATTSSITINSLTDNRGSSDLITLADIGTGSNKTFRNIKISLYKRSTSSTVDYPIGIYMTAMGTKGKTFLDIYGGDNQTGQNITNTISNVTHNSGALAKPKVRIGNLLGLPKVGGIDPVGWGIYTNNGFFEGTLVANQGYIGGTSGWFIGTSKIHSPSTRTSWNINADGIYIATDVIAGGPQMGSSVSGQYASTDPKWYIKANGDVKFGELTYINGTLTVPAAKVTGTLAAGTIQTNVLSALQAKLGTLTSNSLSSIVADIGTITAGVIKHDTVGGTNGIWFSAATDTSSNVTVGNSTARKDWRLLVNNKFGVTTAGNLYASSADITGSIDATSFIARANNIMRAKVDSDGLTIYNKEGTISVANFGKLQDTANYTATIGRIDGYCIHLTAFGGMYFRANNKILGQLSTSGLQWYTNDDTPVLMAHIGYGTTNLESGTGDRPYFTFGSRKTDENIGGYSVAEGYLTAAIGYCSHAEGNGSRAFMPNAHAEGSSTCAYESDTHAEGLGSVAGTYNSTDGTAAHAEGIYTHAEGMASHSQNYYTTAAFDYQTAIGKRNNNKVTNAFEIGNGELGAPSNAFEVDWSGNVNIASGAKYKINGTTLSAADVSAVALSDKYTRSSAGGLDWSNQTDGNAKIIAKSALAFWNGSYDGSTSNLTRFKASNGTSYSFGTLASKNSLSAADVGAVPKSVCCFANSVVRTPSSGTITFTLSELGITNNQKPVGILMTYQDGGSTPTILRYDYDASSANGVIVKVYDANGNAVSSAVRFFMMVFQGSWTGV